MEISIPLLLGWLLGLFTRSLSSAVDFVLRGSVFRIEFNGDEKEYRLPVRIPVDLPRKEFFEAIYVRVKIVCDRHWWQIWPVKSLTACRGFLIGVESRNPDTGEFESVGFYDSVPLLWSYLSKDDAVSGITIPEGVHQYLDVISTQENRPDFDPRTTTWPQVYRLMFDPKANLKGREADFALKLTLLVTTANNRGKQISLVAEWNGGWNQIKVYRWKP